MIYKIREIEKNEYELLNEFLYEAIFIPEGMEKPPKDIIKNKELQVYVKNFGTNKDDNCFVAEYENKIIGACWTRIMSDYGHIDLADNKKLYFFVHIKIYRNLSEGGKKIPY